MVDLTPYKAGIEAAANKTPSVCHDPRSAFMDVLSAEGFKPPRSLQIGKLERLDGAEDKRGKKSAWYVYNEIEDSQNQGSIIGVASYGDWKTGVSENWTSRTEHKMDAQERQRYHQAREDMREQYEAETKVKQSEAAKKAFEIWSKQPAAPDDHPYLKNKGIKSAEGVKLAEDGRLIIPVAVDNQIVSLQYISGDGSKYFMTGGRTKGGWFLIEGESDDCVYIAEGFSTAESIRQATKCSVFVAFNAGNIYEVAAFVKSSRPQARCVIAGDDDTETAGNVGRTKATQAAEGLGFEVVFPIGFNDFNDMHASQGLKAVKKLLSPENLEAYEAEKKTKDSDIARPIGVLGDIADYYNATSGNNQRGFAIQTALAIGSIVVGRGYKTAMENFSPLYLLNVAKSGTGKEHAKTITEKILHQTGLSYLIAGDGYTSAGAVFSTLLDRPKHISVIDEFGRYLEAGREMGKGNHHQREANTKLMEAISRSDSIIRPPSYSSMTLKKEAAEAIKNRQVHNPSITIMAMTTPETLFKSLDMGAIKDGFFNRFIVCISDAERAVRHHKPPIDVPQRIIDWVEQIKARNDAPHIAAEPATTVVLNFSNEAYQMQLDFQKYTNVELPNKLEKYGMAELSGRSNEMAMKISLICALARDPLTKTIEASDMEWSISYIRQALEKTIEALKVTLSHSEYEGQKKEILADLRARGAGGITWADMNKTPPYSQHKQRDLKDIMQSLKDADLAGEEPFKPPIGRPTIKWIALK